MTGTLQLLDDEYRLTMAGEPIPRAWRSVAARDLGWMIAQRTRPLRAFLCDAMRQRYPFESYELSERVLLERARELIERGWWTLLERERERLGHDAVPEDETDTTNEEAAVELPPHHLTFEVVYPDGTAASGWPYRLTDPQGESAEGEVPSDGLIEERNVPEGTYQLEMKEVRSVAWTEPRVTTGDEVGIVAHVSGFATGAAARVRVFLLRRERDGDELATLNASVIDGRVECRYVHDDSAHPERQGRISLVAEVSLDDGSCWAKTVDPLALQLKTFKKARWVPGALDAAGETALRAKLRGFADGTEASITLVRRCPITGEREVATLSASVENGLVTLPLLYTQSSEPDDPILAGDRIQQPGEYFARIVVDDGVRREVRSNLLVCRPDPLAAIG